MWTALELPSIPYMLYDELDVSMPPSVMKMMLRVTGRLFGAAPCQLENMPLGDIRRDAQLEMSDGSLRPAPGHRTADVVRFTTTFNTGRLYLRVLTRDTGEINQRFVIRRAGTLFTIYLNRPVVDGEKQGASAIFLYEDVQPRSCPGLDYVVQDKRHRTVVSIPRRCIGSPRWVRTGVTTFRDADRSDPGQSGWVDDAGRRYHYRAGQTKLGPRVFAG